MLDSSEGILAQAIGGLMRELTDIVDTASQGGDHRTASQRINRWKSRTVDWLSKYISAGEGETLKGEHLMTFSMHDPLSNIVREADMYLAFLRALKEEVENYPESLSVPRTPGKTAITNQSKGEVSHNPRAVFVVHGRNDALRQSLFSFLRSLALLPLEWSQAIEKTKKASPYIGEVLDAAFNEAQAVVVLLSGDDTASLRKDFWSENEKQYETQPTRQARPNVIFEAGMALARNQERTILVQVGDLRPISDIAGRHITYLDDSPEKRQELVRKLTLAGCSLDTSGTDWLKIGCFKDS